MSVKVDLLLKPELIYELKCRGFVISDKFPVSVLRKRLRVVLRDKVDVDVDFYVKNFDANDEWKYIRATVKELKSKASVDSLSPSDVARVYGRLEHVKCRLANIKYFKLDQVSLDACKELELEMDALAQCINILDADVEGREEFCSRLLSDNLLEEERATPVDKGRSILDSVQGLTLRENTAVDTRVNDKVSPWGNDSMYSKLPNPLDTYLKATPVCNGLDSSKLLLFIEQMLKIERERAVSDDTILTLLLQRAESPLRDKILQVLKEKGSITDLQSLVLKAFVPINLRENLKREKVNRVQGPDENVAMYISEVKRYSEILRCDFTERELVNIIKMNLNRETRARAMFAPNPENFADLDELCVVVNNVSYNERNASSAPRVNTQRARGPITCFECGKTGHMARNCYAKKAGSKKTSLGESDLFRQPFGWLLSRCKSRYKFCDN